MSARIRRWAPLAAWAAAIFVLSSFSKLPEPPGPLGWDKLQHAAAYGVGAALAAHALWRSPRWPTLALALVSLYGVSDEIHQSFVPGRSCDVFDWVADTTGALLVVLLIHTLTTRRARRRSTAGAGVPEPVAR